jgi:hypothetical protein
MVIDISNVVVALTFEHLSIQAKYENEKQELYLFLCADSKFCKYSYNFRNILIQRKNSEKHYDFYKNIVKQVLQISV